MRIVSASAHLGVCKAFELAVSLASGRYIFLSDQDDIWIAGKVTTLLEALSQCDLVVSDAVVVNENLAMLYPSFFELRHSRAGLLRNIYKNSYVGCCMALRAEVARTALPIPGTVYMHDVWLGLIADALFRVNFVNTKLILYRRHAETLTEISLQKKTLSVSIVKDRAALLIQLLLRIFRYRVMQRRQRANHDASNGPWSVN